MELTEIVRSDTEPGSATRSVMSRADLLYTWGHARTWACPSVDTERADAYASWYVSRYGNLAMEDLPAHPHAWETFTRDYVCLAPEIERAAFLTSIANWWSA